MCRHFSVCYSWLVRVYHRLLRTAAGRSEDIVSSEAIARRLVQTARCRGVAMAQSSFSAADELLLMVHISGRSALCATQFMMSTSHAPPPHGMVRDMISLMKMPRENTSLLSERATRSPGCRSNSSGAM